MNYLPHLVFALLLTALPTFVQQAGSSLIYQQAAGTSTAAGATERAAMQKVCDAGGTVSAGPDGNLQCDTCPSYTDFEGQHESFSLQATYRGHFSTTNAEQLLLVLGGCESHVSGFGGAVLLTPDGTSWRMTGYFKGDYPRRCLSFRARDAFDRLVCEAQDMHFGTGESVIYSKSYSGNPTSETLLTVGGNLGGGTAAGGRWCYEQDITSFEKLSSDAGLTVAVTQTKGPVPAGEDSCDPNANIKMEPKETIVLHFAFDGQRFELATESKSGMESLQNFVPLP